MLNKYQTGVGIDKSNVICKVIMIYTALNRKFIRGKIISYIAFKGTKLLSQTVRRSRFMD